jgi:shikimate dehydrogenase
VRGAPTAATGLLCLLGHPVAHSLSPVLHNAALAAAGVDAVYLAFDVGPERLADALAGLRAVGLMGANVTVPHKRAVLALADDRTGEADAVGAANTLYWDGNRLVADNTDTAGLRQVLEADVGLVGGAAAVVLGAGGAARAAAVTLGRLGARVTVAARREAAAGEVAELAHRHGAADAGACTPDAATGAVKGADVVVNATPLGLNGEPLPQPFMALGPRQVAVDLVYGPTPTPFCAAAAARGARALDGLGMLVGQAVASFERWTGRPAPVEAMRAGIRAAVATAR